VLVLVTLKAKRQRVLEVKLRRIAAELEAVTGSPPTTIQAIGGGSAAFATQSWVAPNILVGLLQARLEQECPNGGMFHFSAQGDGSDSMVAVEASRVARM
jgi:hypothetical protein